jgi:arylsulfatase A
VRVRLSLWLRSGVIVALGLAGGACSGGSDPAPTHADTRPNIILIQADDLGYGDLSAYGQTRFSTPNLDALAVEGIRFTSYYAGSTVCAPSRATLMTGQHTGHTWVRGNGEVPLRAEDTTIAMTLANAGYRTAQIGKWGLGRQGTPGLPSLKGFEYNFSVLDHRQAHRQFTEFAHRNDERVPLDVERDYVNDLFTQETLDYIAQQDDRPFFIYLNYTVPHAELWPPEGALAKFSGRFDEPRPYVNEAADARRAGYEDRTLGYRSQPTPRAAFAAMVTRLDEHVGRIVDAIDAAGLGPDTLILFTSDNGPHREGGADPEFFGSSGPLRGIKRDLYEGGIRVPMIARWTGTIPAGGESDHPWAHWDMLPTLAALGGVSPPSGIDGMSMAAALRGERQDTHDFFYWEFHERGFQQAVRTDDWKAVRLEPGAPLELYDLATDLGETTNVADAYPDVVAQIETYLQSARTPSERWPTPQEQEVR